MNRYYKINPVTDEKEVVMVPDDPNAPIDISQDPDDIFYSTDTFEDYKEFCKRAKLE